MNKRVMLFCVAAVLSAPVVAAPQCTQQTSRGTWMFTCEGELPVGVPTRSLGTCEASRTAFWECAGKANVGGTVVDQTLAGQAHNAADCTGTISYTQTINGNTIPGTLDIFYVISADGDVINGLPLNSGGVLACSLKRLGR